MLPKSFLRRMVIGYLEKGVGKEDYELIKQICEENDWRDILFLIDCDTNFDVEKYQIGYTEAKCLLNKD